MRHPGTTRRKRQGQHVPNDRVEREFGAERDRHLRTVERAVPGVPRVNEHSAVKDAREGWPRPNAPLDLLQRKPVVDVHHGLARSDDGILTEAAQKAANKVSEKATEAKNWAGEQIDKVQNRIEEKKAEARNADEEARVDDAAKNG